MLVHDHDPVAQVHASSVAFDVVEKEKLLRESQLIFCATGNKALSGSDFELLQEGAFIASCTSSDDEFDMSSLYRLSGRRSGDIQPYQSLSGGNINFLADGNAVNFVFNGVNGPHIYAVQAGLMAGVADLMAGKNTRSGTISSLSLTSQRDIAKVWMKFF